MVDILAAPQQAKADSALRTLEDTDTMLLVDCVTSLGGSELEIDAWGVDAAYSGTQKCLGVPPGLSPVTFSERAVTMCLRAYREATMNARRSIKLRACPPNNVS